MALIKKNNFYNKINRFAQKAGFSISRFPSRNYRQLLQYLESNNINDCFDVGANVGQYAGLVRSIGFKGNIYSFEPQSKAFEHLAENASGDGRWQAFNIGLGNTNGQSVINISKNSVSSSILDIHQSLTTTSPETAYISKEEICVKRLDTFLKEINFTNKFFLKIDAQGFESKILDGAEECFNDIFALQIELSYVSLYDGEKLFDEMKPLIESKGFYLSSLENGFSDNQSGRLLQVEAIFLREC